MNKLLNHFFIIPFLAISFLGSYNATSQENYIWKNVAIGGGGFVTGIAIHPKERGILYARTDVGGLFKWDNKNIRWTQLLDWVGYDQVAYRNVDGIALDPNNPDLVYITSGSDVLKSSNRGKTWTFTGLNKTFLGNGNKRWYGENIAVDPVNSNILFCGTRNDGLYFSADATKSWTYIDNVPNGIKDIGIRSIVFDSSSAKDGICQFIYIGLPNIGIYISKNAGKTFELIKDCPTDANRMAITSDGNLLVTHSKGVSKYNGNWKDISPCKEMEFCGLEINPKNPKHFVVSEYREDCMNKMFQTFDAGLTWKEIERKIHFETAPGWFTYDPDVANGAKSKPRKWTYFAAAVSSLAFDPFENGKLFFTDWYAIWWTNNITDNVTDWFTNEKGHEETVVLSVVSPSAGSPLFSLMADNVGFRHFNIDTFPSQRLTDKGEGICLDYCEKRPSHMAMIDAEDWWGKNTRILVSGDSGKTFKPIGKPEGISGRVAVSSNNPGNIIYLPSNNKKAFCTVDFGETWNEANGLPEKILDRNYVFNYNQPLASDKADGSVFYVFSKGHFYSSIDNGKNWEQTKGIIPDQEGDGWDEKSKADPTTEFGFVNVKTAPAKKGIVWVSLGNGGLLKSYTGGNDFQKDAFFEQARCLAWGKASPASDSPTAYVYGTHKNKWGLFRSTDLGKTWVQINDQENALARPYAMDGDKNVYGRIYISVGGRGVFYGEIIKD